MMQKAASLILKLDYKKNKLTEVSLFFVFYQDYAELRLALIFPNNALVTIFS